MRDANLFEAWRIWAEGELDLSLQLWSISLLWWGRIGKLLQFLGALTVLLDLIGPERLRAAGRRLREEGFPRPLVFLGVLIVVFSAVASALSVLAISADSLDRFREWTEQTSDQLLDLSIDWLWNTGWKFYLAAAALFLLTLVTFVWVSRKDADEVLERLRGGAELTAYGGCAVVATPFIITVVIALVGIAPVFPGLAVFAGLVAGITRVVIAVGGKVADAALLRPIAWTLDRRRPGHPVRWAGVAFLLIGFHFDLLAS